MATGHTDERIRKLAARGLSTESIARKIGRPGDVARVQRALERVACAACGRDLGQAGTFWPRHGDLCPEGCPKKQHCEVCDGTGIAPGCSKYDRERGDLWRCLVCLDLDD